MVSRVAEVFFSRGFEARRRTGLAGESRPGELMPFFPFLSAFAAISASIVALFLYTLGTSPIKSGQHVYRR